MYSFSLVGLNYSDYRTLFSLFWIKKKMCGTECERLTMSKREGGGVKFTTSK